MHWDGKTVRISLILLLFCAVTSYGQIFDLPPSLPLDRQKPLDEDARRAQRSASQLEMRGEFDEALNLYLELYEEYPGNIPFYDGVVRNFVATAKYEPGLVWVDSLRNAALETARPADLTAFERELLLNYIIDGGRFLGKAGDRAAALARWETIYDIPRASTSAFYRLFNAYIEIRYPEGLEEMARRARELTGDPTLLASALAGFYTTQGRADRAVEEWLRLMEQQPRQAGSITQRILGMPEDENTRTQVEQALKKGLSRPAIKKEVVELLGSFYFRSRQWEQAYAQVKEADRLGGDSGLAMLIFAENLISEGIDDLALTVLSDLALSHPALADSPRGLLARARAAEASGGYALADSLYSRLTETNQARTAQGQEALLDQARMRLHTLNQPNEARRILEEGLQRVPRMRNPGDVILLIGDTYLTELKLARARETYLEAAGPQYGRQPDLKARAQINAALIDFYSEQYDSALEELKEASGTSPDNELTNNALDYLYLIRSSRSDSVNLGLFARAELSERTGNRPQARELLQQIAQSRSQGELPERALIRLAEYERAEGRIDSALALLEDLLQRYPEGLNVPDVLMTMGHIHEIELNDPKGASEYYEKILIDFPASLQVEEARKRLRNLVLPET